MGHRIGPFCDTCLDNHWCESAIDLPNSVYLLGVEIATTLNTFQKKCDNIALKQQKGDPAAEQRIRESEATLTNYLVRLYENFKAISALSTTEGVSVNAFMKALGKMHTMHAIVEHQCKVVCSQKEALKPIRYKKQVTIAH